MGDAPAQRIRITRVIVLEGPRETVEANLELAWVPEAGSEQRVVDLIVTCISRTEEEIPSE